MAFAPQELTASTLKSFVDRLLAHTQAHPPQRLPETPVRRAWAQEAVAAALGWPNWHAAITTAQARTQAPTPGANDSWTLPTALLQSSEILPRLGGSSLPDGEGPWRVPARELSKHARLWGQEATRREFIEHVSRLNPERPLLVLQGPASLPLRRWNGTSSARTKSFDDALTGESAADLTELLTGLMDESEHDNAWWKSRAISLLSDVLAAAVWMRDHAQVQLKATGLLEHITLGGVDCLSRQAKLPPLLAGNLMTHLRALPGFQLGAPTFGDVMREQHGYIQMYLTAPIQRAIREGWYLGSLTQPSARQTSVDLTAISLRQQAFLGLHRAIDTWVNCHPGGLVVLDGLDVRSDLWSLLAVRLPRWREAQVGAWIGISVQEDLPEEPLRTRLMARVDGQIHLVENSKG